MRVVRLCHLVQGTSHQLADYAGVPYAELEWACAGINHLSWFTTLRHTGRDLYPVLRRKVRESRELREQDPVRFDMLLHFGAFVTESSGHCLEYVPYYRKRPEPITRYCRAGYLEQAGFYAENWPRWRRKCDDGRRRILTGGGWTDRRVTPFSSMAPGTWCWCSILRRTRPAPRSPAWITRSRFSTGVRPAGNAGTMLTYAKQ